uniref:Uncharacterized protein n=1 Tax=Ditylenchus dipsaci TaxID=166011 RepID=A0A915D5Y1_9BILA
MCAKDSDRVHGYGCFACLRLSFSTVARSQLHLRINIDNRCCWSTLDNILEEEGLSSGGLDYLKDVDLEKRVMERIDKTRPPQFGNPHNPGEPAESSDQQQQPPKEEKEKEEKQIPAKKREDVAAAAVKVNPPKPPSASPNKRPKPPRSLAKPKS